MKMFLRLMALSCLVPAMHAASPPSRPEYVEGEAIVTFRDSADLAAAERALAAHELKFERRFAALSAHRGKQFGLVRAPGRTTADLIAELAKDPAIEMAEPNYFRWPT